MNTVSVKPKRSGRFTPLGIAAFVLGFMVWWPLGLAILAYIIWGGSVDELVEDTVAQVKGIFRSSPAASTGNSAFDAYREETLKRLEEERREFEEFVIKLRQARDKEEFERFMAERNGKTTPAKKRGGK